MRVAWLHFRNRRANSSPREADSSFAARIARATPNNKDDVSSTQLIRFEAPVTFHVYIFTIVEMDQF